MSMEYDVLAEAAMIIDEEAIRIESARIARGKEMNETITRNLLSKAGIIKPLSLDEVEDQK